METTGAKILHHPANIQNSEQATHDGEPVREIPPDPNACSPGAPSAEQTAEAASSEADLLTSLAALGVNEERLKAERRRAIGEISALRAENRWEDILSLFHPVEEKNPELVASGRATAIRGEVAFALGHLGRFDEAIALYHLCVEEEPDNFHHHSGLAYTAYDSLYAARGRQIVLHPEERKARIELAHRHFAAAQSLRPNRVTNYYRQGMLYKSIQGKKEEALPLFAAAVRNWEAYSAEEMKARHQERKNYVKALYQLASCELDAGKPSRALETLNRCLLEDEEPGFFSTVHKYFALGKVRFELGDMEASVQALSFAASQAVPEEDDYVFELLARVHLCRGDGDKAWEAVNRVPLKRRRPYFRWTEAEVLIARGEWERARKVLVEAAERDRRGRHKALLRLARLEFRLCRYDQCLKWAKDADSFFRNQFQNPCGDGLFWQAAAFLRLGRLDEAENAARKLAKYMPRHPHLGRLRDLIAKATAAGPA